MKIGILAAMQKELALLLPLLEGRKEESVDGLALHTGRIGGHEVAMMQCGIGKVNSALNTYRLIHAFSPELIINSGVAGGADKSMKIGTVLVAEYAAYHDVWCGPGTETGAADGMSVFLPAAEDVVATARRVLPEDGVRYGLICSGDRFISTAAEVRAIKKSFPSALACDMESASIAQVSLGCGVPFSIVRVVSDTPGEGENIEQYKDFWTEAPRKTFEVVKRIIDALPVEPK
ncbi:MAG: 5'-methylthioadenosine/adenosylhomocysteine nucleosidase [Muribaculaceae bacterium]|nr:5'-methylthioadenosine/adenosylhomocysteine nucleosidase [Muribaculaceae bacterium]